MLQMIESIKGACSLWKRGCARLHVTDHQNIIYYIQGQRIMILVPLLSHYYKLTLQDNISTMQSSLVGITCKSNTGATLKLRS